jgi:hypothetical protein
VAASNKFCGWGGIGIQLVGAIENASGMAPLKTRRSRARRIDRRIALTFCPVMAHMVKIAFGHAE